MKKTTKVLLIVIFAVSVVFFSTNLLIAELKNRQGTNEDISKVNIKVIENVSAQDQGRDIANEASALHQTYPDAIGWLKVSGTTIDAPVFQGPDNTRYLRNDRDYKQTKWGEIFLDYRSNINKLDTMSNNIIYGHNTETNESFGTILRYKDPNFFKNNKTIELSTISGNYKWEIFTVYVTKASFYYIDTKFESAKVYSDFLHLVKSLSMYDTGVSVNGDEPILTLSTCDYSTPDGRFVIQAKLVK